MTFLSQQKFDDQGNIKVFKSKKRILENFSQSDDGQIQGQARVKIETGEIGRDKLEPMDNISQAEEYVLEVGQVFWPASRPPLNTIDPESHFAHRLSNAASKIATRTGRGFGNTVVCHPEMRETVDACWDKTKTVKEYNPLIDDTMDVEKSYFQQPLEVFENDMAPEDSVLVLYRGQDDTDQPLIYVDGEGLVINDSLADIADYGFFVRI